MEKPTEQSWNEYSFAGENNPKTMQDRKQKYSKQNVKESTQKEMNHSKEQTSNEANSNEVIQQNQNEQANGEGEQTTAPDVAEAKKKFKI